MRHRRGESVPDRDLTNGPGKLCAALAITGANNGARLDQRPLSILRGESVGDADVGNSRRIGITRAADWPLRWFVKGNPFVSRAPGTAPRRAPRTHAR
jgi:DNA-3-methyladenine glycosylase